MLTDVVIGFYQSELKVKMTFEEYKEVLHWISEQPNVNSFATFNIENGAGEITFRSDDIRFIKY